MGDFGIQSLFQAKSTHSGKFMSTTKNWQFVDYLWKPEEAAKLDPVSQLIYRSNILGKDPRITNTRGGNTSAKITEKDPLTGKDTEVLWVNGSGGDLR